MEMLTYHHLKDQKVASCKELWVVPRNNKKKPLLDLWLLLSKETAALLEIWVLWNIPFLLSNLKFKTLSKLLSQIKENRKKALKIDQLLELLDSLEQLKDKTQFSTPMFKKIKQFSELNQNNYLVSKIPNQKLEVLILTIKSTLTGFSKFINKKLMLEDRQKKKGSSTTLELIKTITAEIKMPSVMNLLGPWAKIMSHNYWVVKQVKKAVHKERMRKEFHNTSKIISKTKKFNSQKVVLDKCLHLLVDSTRNLQI